MLEEQLRVMLNGRELAVLVDEEEALVIDVHKKEVCYAYVGWGDEENPITEYVNLCNEIVYIDKYLLDILTNENEEMYIDLTKKGISNILTYVREVL